MTAVLSPADASAKLLDVAVVADLLGCSAGTFTAFLIPAGCRRPIKLGALVRWNRAAVESWIDQGCPAVRSMRGGTQR